MGFRAVVGGEGATEKSVVVAMTEGEWKGLNNPTELTHFVKREVGTQAQREKSLFGERLRAGKQRKKKFAKRHEQRIAPMLYSHQLSTTRLNNCCKSHGWKCVLGSASLSLRLLFFNINKLLIHK